MTSPGSEAMKNLGDLITQTVAVEQERFEEVKRIAMTVDNLGQVLQYELQGYRCGSDTAVAAANICTKVFNICIEQVRKR